MRLADDRPPAAIGAAAFAIPFSVYAATAAPTLHWLDASELAAAAVDLGVPHPPGEPLAVLVGRLFALLPAGTLAFRVALASAAAAAIACWLAYRIAWRLLARVEEGLGASGSGRLPRALCALGAALVLGFTQSLWQQAVRAEVYALSLALALGAVDQALAWDASGDDRHPGLSRAALLVGLALGCHTLLAALCGVAIAGWAASRGAWRALGRAAIPAAIGGSVLGAVPLFAARWPEVNWGAPVAFDRFLWVITAAPFARTVGRVAESEPLAARAESVAMLPVWQLGVLAVVGLGGAWILLRVRATRRAGALLVAIAAAHAVSPLLVGFDPFNPDAHGYLLPLVAAAALLGAAGAWGAAATVAAARPVRGRAAAWAAAAALLCAAPWQAARHAAAADLREAWSADTVARAALAAAPPGGGLVTHDFRTVFNLWYLRVAEGLRPDVTHVHAGFLGFPGLAEALDRRQPGWRRVEPGAPGVAVEYHDDLDPLAIAWLRGAGVLVRPDGGAAEHSRRWGLLNARLGPPDRWDHETARAILWTHYRLARFFCRAGDPVAARIHLRAAARLSRSPRIAELERECAAMAGR